MLVVTNRNINENKRNGNVSDETAFGEQVNAKGPNELRLAHAKKVGSKWNVEIVPEPKNMNVATAPSRLEYKKLVKACSAAGKHALFFVHGYNKSFPETLEQGWYLQNRFGIEVVLFSWPANPGGLPPSEYRHARRIAQASFGALDSALEKVGRYMHEEPFNKKRLVECEITINLMTYSLGNYLFQNYIVSNEYAQETRLFSNVILCQADVDSDGHESWVERIVAGHRVYVTLNENDKVLGFSETVNYPRLGKTIRNLKADNARYLDFTLAKGVGNIHQIWGEVNTKTVKTVFSEAFSGRRAEEVKGVTYYPQANAYRVP